MKIHLIVPIYQQKHNAGNFLCWQSARHGKHFKYQKPWTPWIIKKKLWYSPFFCHSARSSSNQHVQLSLLHYVLAQSVFAGRREDRIICLHFGRAILWQWPARESPPSQKRMAKLPKLADGGLISRMDLFRASPSQLTNSSATHTNSAAPRRRFCYASGWVNLHRSSSTLGYAEVKFSRCCFLLSPIDFPCLSTSVLNS